MINNCNNKNPLLRDGTSQQQRLLKALLPGYVSVDERSMDDLVKFAREYAKEIQYYSPSDIPNGDWYDFFTKTISSDQRTEPHYALFIAFLELFRFAQDDLNTITKRHLDFYYKDVLRIKEKDAVPDQVHIIFELAQNVGKHLIAKGTVLKAGKDNTGKDLFYKTDKDIVVNRAKVKELKALFLDNGSGSLNLTDRLYASPIANSADGRGMELEGKEPRWRTFGRPVPGDPARTEAMLGFAIASPVLALAEGKRTITIKLRFQNHINHINNALNGFDIKNMFRIYFSGEKEWIDTGLNTAQSPESHVFRIGNLIEITRTLSENDPAVVAYNEAVLKDAIHAKWPVAKVLVNTEMPLSPYHALKDLVLTRVDIDVDVQGVTNLILQNDFADLDPAKPFEPFTIKPAIGSSFYIGSNEIFKKHLTSLDINIVWQGLPGNFATHYLGYKGFSAYNQKFKTQIDILHAKKWTKLKTDQLFDATLDDTRVIEIGSPLNTIPADPSMEEITGFDTNTKKGFIRLNLVETDFGHKQYQPTYVEESIKLVNKDTTAHLPNEPYTPSMKSITLDYKSTAVINFATQAATEKSFASRVDQYFHFLPFGISEVHAFITGPVRSLLPVYQHQGTLYIGIESLEPPQILSLLFQVAEGSADPELLPQEIEWSYLSGNKWLDIDKKHLLADSTNGLLTSGIITFDIPKAASSNNTALTSGLHWLRAAVKKDSAAVCDLISVSAQAVTATFDDRENDPEHLKVSLLAESVKELNDGDSQVEKLVQPYASFGGKMREQGSEFYTRVSERLRHKRRAITIWDYEHLVLEQFPSIYKVKCLNHTIKGFDASNKPVYSEIAPGHVTLLTVSNLRNKNAADPLRPKTSLMMLDEIKQYIKKINPPCIDLHVVNPFFEEIQVTFKVRFKPGYDTGFYTKQLEEEIKQFLAPWAYNAIDVVIGGKIHRSVIINFIDEREYVDFISCFRMDQMTATGMLPNIEEAAPTTASSVLTSAATHKIETLKTDDCECPDNEVHMHNISQDDCDCETTDPYGEDANGTGAGAGIGIMTVGNNFIIGASNAQNGIDFMQIGNDFDIQ